MRWLGLSIGAMLLLGGMVLLLPAIDLGAQENKLKKPMDPVPDLVPPPPLFPTFEGKSEKGVNRLKNEREALTREREQAAREVDLPNDINAAERVRLRMEILQLIQKLDERKKEPPKKMVEIEPIKDKQEPGKKEKTESKMDMADLTKEIRSLDPLNQAQVLYQSNEFTAALKAFRLIDVSVLARDEKAFVQYMQACCLRRLGKLSEAAVIYREVAEAKDDAFLTECALWQLSSIRSRQELETQLEDIRARRKSR